MDSQSGQLGKISVPAPQFSRRLASVPRYWTAPGIDDVRANAAQSNANLFTLMYELEPHVRDTTGACAHNWLSIRPGDLAKRSKLAARKVLTQTLRSREAFREQIPYAEAVDLRRITHKLIKIRGLDHSFAEEPCQDEVLLYRDEHCLLGVVADGAGAYALTHFGARILGHIALDTVRDIIARIRPRATQPSETILQEEFLTELYEKIYLRLGEVLYNLQMRPEDALKTFLPATLQIVVVLPQEYFVVALGDGFFGAPANLRAVCSVLQRSPRLTALNCPPMIGSALMLDNGHAPMPNLDDVTRAALHDEAKAFHIVHHGFTEDLLKEDFICGTDGLRFATETQPPAPLDRMLGKMTSGRFQRVALLAGLANIGVKDCSDAAFLQALIPLLDCEPELTRVVSSTVKAELVHELTSQSLGNHELTSFLLERRPVELLQLVLRGSIKGVRSLPDVLRAARITGARVLREVMQVSDFPRQNFAFWDDTAFIHLSANSYEAPGGK